MIVFSKNHCEYWKGFSADHCFLPKLEKWKQCFGKKKVFLALKTGLSKAYVAKLNVYTLTEGHQDLLRIIWITESREWK